MSIMGVPKRLTEMQKRFAEYLVFNEGKTTGAEAAIAAGYSKDRARQEASELRNPRLSPLVVKYIGELREENQKKYAIDFERHIAELAKIRELAIKRGSFSSAVNAEVNRGKAAGLYVEQKIIKTGKLEDMTEQELENRMKQIINDYAPILDAKPIEEIKKEVRSLSTKAKTKLQPLKKVASTQTSATSNGASSSSSHKPKES
jgi:phage terminase small subunit